MEEKRPSILFVDDDVNILDGLKRQLRRKYHVVTALSGPEGLELLKSKGPFPVVVSDMKMPIMNGSEFLKRARETSPDTVRILLTGQADFNDTIEAINEGNIFRFIHKPCPIPLLVRSLEDALEQYRLITDQRVLLEETLQGSIKALTEILALSNPAAFGRTGRTKQIVSVLLNHLEIEVRWPIEVAAMLSQIGYVALSAEVAEKIYKGERLTLQEQEQADSAPKVTSALLGSIPRLESVMEILEYMNASYSGTKGSRGERTGQDIPFGARILKLVLDYDDFVTRMGYAKPALAALKERHTWYDPALLERFIKVNEAVETDISVARLKVHQVKTGMVFANDITTESGQLLVARGQEVTESLLLRIQMWAESGTIKKEMTMILPKNEKEEPVEAL